MLKFMIGRKIKKCKFGEVWKDRKKKLFLSYFSKYSSQLYNYIYFMFN